MITYIHTTARAVALFLLMAAFCSLAGCSLLLGPGEGPARLQLNPALPGPLAGNKASGAVQLTVARPKATGDIDTDGIACIFDGREVRNLKGYRWAAPAPALLQRALVDGLESTGAFASVSDDASGLSSFVRLQTDIKQFGLFYPAEKSTPTAVLEATFRLMNFSTGHNIDALPLRVDVPASGTKPEALAAACERAVAEMLTKVAPWVIDSTQGLKK